MGRVGNHHIDAWEASDPAPTGSAEVVSCSPCGWIPLLAVEAGASNTE